MQSGNTLSSQEVQELQNTLNFIHHGTKGLSSSIGLFGAVVNLKSRELDYFSKRCGRRIYGTMTGLCAGALCYSHDLLKSHTSAALALTISCLAWGAAHYYEKQYEKHIVESLKKERALIDTAIAQNQEVQNQLSTLFKK